MRVAGLSAVQCAVGSRTVQIARRSYAEIHARIQSRGSPPGTGLEQEGWTRPKENTAKPPKRSGRGGRSHLPGGNAIPAILCKRPPALRDPLLFQERSRAMWTVLPSRRRELLL